MFDRLFKPSVVAHAHCDIPCGIYDPTAAKVAADTVAKMVEKISALQPGATDFTTRGNFVRMTLVKEEHAQICKKELEILWSDYFKPEHLEKFPKPTTSLEGRQACSRTSRMSTQRPPLSPGSRQRDQRMF